MELLTTKNGGIPLAPGGDLGGQVTRPGQLQYGDMLMGGLTSARWRQLVGWRDLPEPAVSDALRPQAHGAYPGDVWGGALTVTYDYLVRGTPEAKLAALAAIELHTPMDGIERPLVVNDGAGPTMRMARVIGRQLPPMDKAYTPGPLACSLQFLCADPRRYALSEVAATAKLPTSVGGMDYPLTYPLTYGTSVGGAVAITNQGGIRAPMVATFTGPLTNPRLSSSDGWVLQFNIELAAGEQLVVDTYAGTAKLGTADRLYTIDALSTPVEACTLPLGTSSVKLFATAGTGTATVTYRPAYL